MTVAPLHKLLGLGEGSTDVVPRYWANLPVGAPDCPDCGGSGFWKIEDCVGRCGCMPPFMIRDRITGELRFGSLAVDGRRDGNPVSMQEAEHRHQKGACIARQAIDNLQEGSPMP